MKIRAGMVAAITGAGSGIGLALALELARRGCVLALSDIDNDRLEQAAVQVRALGASATTTQLDVADRDAVFAWAADTVQAHGRVNMIFNNAGVALTAMAETTQPDDFKWLMGINFWGVVHGTQAFLPRLRTTGEGHIVNISSVFGLVAAPTQGAYNASKFAVRGFTEALRMELELEGQMLSATCIHPGGVATNIALSGRVHKGFVRSSGIRAQAHRDLGHSLIQVTTPESAARQIIAGVERNAARVVVGSDARIMDWCVRIFGSGYRWLVLKKVRTLPAFAPRARRKAKT
ncbi:MAG: SDR family NAD(P)-dependent oxidoreductase [Pseudomonadota bacterium]